MGIHGFFRRLVDLRLRLLRPSPHTEKIPDRPIDEPAMVTFLLLLPDPLPIEDLSTYTILVDEDEPLLKGVPQTPVKGMDAIINPGKNFVSLQFIQVRNTSQPNMAQSLQTISEAMRRVAPRAHRKPLAKSKTPWDPEFLTVVSAVTFARDADSVRADEDRPDALTRCIEALIEFHRAYRLERNERILELTYHRIFPIIPWFLNSLFAQGKPKPQGFIMLDHFNLKMPPTEPLNNNSLGQLSLRQMRLQHADPFMLYSERRLEAMRSFFTEGRYDESCVQSAIAAEVLLNGLLSLILWEEALDSKIEDSFVVGIFSSDNTVTKRVKSQYGSRLGGTWNLDSEPLNNWHEHVANIRNRVVHSGYRPDRVEAHRALDSLEALERFVGDRLNAKVNEYPRTAWTFLGEGGFERRSNIRKAQSKLDEIGGDPIIWLSEHKKWRAKIDRSIFDLRK